MWCVSTITKEYEQRMMDVLEVYERSYDSRKPVVCIDEKSVALREESRKSQSMKPGRVRRKDYEYIRHGVANIFVAVEPKGKHRVLRSTKRRTKKDFARFMQYLLVNTYADAERVVMVLDNLNTHFATSFYETFSKEEADRLLSRLELHYTPKHASWLNMAEIELSALSTQCLKRTIGTFQTLQRQIAIWKDNRNRKQIGIHWQFTRKKAQDTFKLKVSRIM